MPSVALWLNVLAPVLAAGVVNGVIYRQGWSSDSNGSRASMTSRAYSELLPPGWAIALIWTLLFALLGYAHYRVFPSVASFDIMTWRPGPRRRP